MNILGYGGSTAAGKGVAPFWNGLKEGKDHSRTIQFGATETKMCAFDRTAFSNYCEFLANKLFEAYLEMNIQVPKEELGILFASTKGCIDDFVWNKDHNEQDPYMPIVREFLKKSKLENTYHLVVSNACASSISALYLAQEWLNQKRFKYVLVLAGDMIGPFVARGFQVLKVSSPEICKPFDETRTGTQLGDAACCFLLSSEPGPYKIENVQIDTEGFAVTRHTSTGESLRRVCAEITNPDLIIAHGTGTQANDEVESKVFSEMFPATPITGTKWSVGHSLGASSAVDTIAACEVLKNQTVFGLANTKKPLKGNFILDTAPKNLKKVLVTSLGFGGVHAAMTVGLND